MSAAGENTARDAEASALYRRYESRLRSWLGWRLSSAPPALVEDACASAWLILITRRPDCGERIFGWLRTTALHEAYRLLRQQQREQASELGDGEPAFVLEGRDDLETALEAKRALGTLASLRERQRRYLTLKTAGYSYREIAAIAGTGSTNNVNKHMTRARARLRWLCHLESELAEPRSEKGGDPMATGTCRRCGLRPRRISRGAVEPLCEECYQQALERVTRQLEEESAGDGRSRYRKLKLSRGSGAKRPDRVAPVARADARPLGGAAQKGATPGRRPRCISEELLREAKRLYGLGLSLRAVAETLLEHTDYANAHSAEVALRFQFKRRGWPIRTRAEAQRARRAAQDEDLARAA